MKMKTISFILFALVSVFLLTGMVSALTLSTPGVLDDATTSRTISVTNNQNASQDITLSIADVSGIDFVVSPTSITSLENGSSSDVLVSVASVSEDVDFGEYKTELSASGTLSSDSVEVIYVKGFCETGPAGNDLEISSVDINSDGDDDLEWSLLDEITIEVEIENNGDDDIRDIIVELGLFDSDGKNVVDDLEFTNTDEEEIDMGRLKEDEDETVEFKFKVPADFDEDDYQLAVKAYSEDLEEENECVDRNEDFDKEYYEDVSVIREDDIGKYIAFDNIELSQPAVTCGDSVTLTFDIYNIGDEDLEDRVKVNVVNKELNIELSEEIKKDLDQGDKASFEFTFTIPQDVKNKEYELDLWAQYDYYKGEYDESSDDEETKIIEIIGCAEKVKDIASISAVMQSEEARAGEELVVKATITNPGDKELTYLVSVDNYDSWAEFGEISDQLVTVNAGESEDITITFNVNKDADGEKSFVIEATAEGNTKERDVKVNIEPKTSLISGLGSGNTLIWVIGIVNVILIILIIVVAIKLSRG